MSQQTAVEWLVKEFGLEDFKATIMLAKAKEKEQIIRAFDEGQEYEYQYHINSAPKFYSETYYKETYNK
jgi:hypothetical protein